MSDHRFDTICNTVVAILAIFMMAFAAWHMWGKKNHE